MNIVLGTAKGWVNYHQCFRFSRHALMHLLNLQLLIVFFFVKLCDISQFWGLTWFRITYLHEGLEPKVVHRDIKSSNILLDKRWNPKVSDFGLAKLLGSDNNYVTTRVMGTFG